MAAATKTVTEASNLPGKLVDSPATYKVGSFSPEVQAACAERRAGEDIWAQLGRLYRERNEARGALRAVVSLARTKKLSAREGEGLKALYAWLEDGG